MTEQVKANTEVSEFKIIDDEKNTPTLKEAQAFVGGYVECITWPNGDLLIVNEEGKLMNLPLNPEKKTHTYHYGFNNEHSYNRIETKIEVDNSRSTDVG